MKFLHTSDWHVGRTVRGRSRAEEHVAVLEEIAEIADREQVDAVLIAGDQYDVSAPSAESHRIVNRARMNLAATGAQVIEISGNHDNPFRLDADAPLAHANRIHILGQVSRPDEGGVLDVQSRDGKETAKVVRLPFLSQRGIVKASDLMESDEDEHAGKYADRVRRIVESLAQEFSDDTVNIIMGHLTVVGGGDPQLGGGERMSHVAFDYFVPPQIFPASAQYVALGHLHKMHQIPAPAPVFYCGAPLHMDFGESGDRYVLLVEAEAGEPSEVTPVKLTAGNKLVTVKGTLADIENADIAPNDWVRIILREAHRAGLSEEVRQLVPNVVDILIEKLEDESDPDEESTWNVADFSTDTDTMFSRYLEEEGVDDPEMVELFSSVLERYHEHQDTK